LVGDTDSKSGVEASDIEDELEEAKEDDDHCRHRASEEQPQAATSSGGLPNWGLPQGRNTNIHPSSQTPFRWLC
jgi:hypothetical protein